jgi:uncharacterized DUF497 family protein
MRANTLDARGLDFLDVELVFDGWANTINDDRLDDGEIRKITAAHLHRRFVVVVSTSCGSAGHVISLRYGHAREENRFHLDLG